MIEQQLIQIALTHHGAGRLPEAERIYRQILTANPRNPDALHYLGVLAQATGKPDVAVQLIRQALALRPGDANALSNLGIALGAAGRREEAVESYRRAIAIDPRHADAHFNLATLLRDTGRWDEAVAEFRAAMSVRPDFPNCVWSLGRLLMKQGKYADAVALYGPYLDVHPDDAVMLSELGMAHRQANNLEQAAAAYGRALAVDPDLDDALVGRGTALEALERRDEAIRMYRAALLKNPRRPAVLRSFGGALLGLGLTDQAIVCFRASIDLDPASSLTWSTLLFAMLNDPAAGAAELAAEHRRWNLECAAKYKSSIAPHANDPDPDRRIKIGYVSSDFREHPVGHQFLPILEARDRTGFEVTCYSNGRCPGAVQTRFKQTADRWREVNEVDDDQLERMIRDDVIDVLVDLNVHSGDHRLLTFARKPAPVQMTYLGYCGTTGLQTMDYRISDPYLDPPGTDLSNYSEQTVRLDSSYWCYRPPDVSPDVEESPVTAKGFVTFGSMNTVRKLSPPVLESWQRILLGVPGSKIMIHAPFGEVRDRLASMMEKAGIDAGRIIYVGKQSRTDYLATFGQIDISLDPFPYAGGITSCDSLWMGVPLVTLNGRHSPVSRGGVSILQNLGLPELVGQNVDEYCAIAIALASDQGRMVELRRTMRERMLRSPLMDLPKLTANLESIYRRAWRTWCQQQRPTGG